MINTDKNKVIWLVQNDHVVWEFKTACERVYAWYDQSSSYEDNGSMIYRVKQATAGGCFDYTGLNYKDVNNIVCALGRQGKIKWSDVNPLWQVQKSYAPALTNFMRVVCVVMWARKAMIAPLGFPTPAKADGYLDEICLQFPHISALKAVRSLHVGSQIEGAEYGYNDNGRRATLWARLLLSTTLYRVDDFDPDDLLGLIANSYGEGNLVCRGYDTIGFIQTIYPNHPKAIELLSSFAVSTLSQKAERAGKTAENKRIREAARGKRSRESLKKDYNNSIQVCAAYAVGTEDLPLVSLIKAHLLPLRYKAIFDLGSEFYKLIDPRVAKMVKVFSAQVEGFIIFKRYENPNLANSNAIILYSYIAMYLPRFFIDRDGNMDDYPTSLNDFSSFLYVTWDRQGSEKTFKFVKRPPMTLLAFVEMQVNVHGLSVDTHYQKVKSFDLLFSYIQEHSLHIDQAGKFKNSINASCYPRVARSYSSNKKTLPRKYFSAFVSMLYSFEYLVMHLNLMADGEQCGVKNDRPVLVSEQDLRFNEYWSGIWGTGIGVRAIDLSVLNYCPIFYSDGKIYPFEYIPRFYNPSDYEIFVEKFSNGLPDIPEMQNHIRKKVQRVAPNDVRVTQVMCETGFRQLHTVWLHLQQYDKRVDRSSDTPLTVLQVATDKAHGAWTAIVARHVVAILDRQRAWYKRCSDPMYAEDVFYNGSPASKFGAFQPLFRKYIGAPKSWRIYTKFPIFLAALKYFIERQVGDGENYNLVNIKSDEGEIVEFNDYSSDPANSFAWVDLCSDYTPHGLRAAFITDALNFLPPSIIGQYFTGQTPEQVLYYQIVDGVQIPGHRSILTEFLSRNLDAFSATEAPEIAERIIKLNASLAVSIKDNVLEAIQKFGLVSLQGIKDGQNGLDLLIAKKFTELAYNATHICPFANKCPVEVIKMLGNSRPCAVCPFAIRGVMHLPAINAEKDKYKELMVGVVAKLKVYISRDQKFRDIQEIENLNAEHDFYAREAFAFEAVEQQLYELHKTGNSNSFIVQAKEELTTHFERIELDSGSALMKRLVDVLAWPSATSPELDLRFANVRNRLLMHDGRLEELLKIPDGPPAPQLFSLVKSMVDSGRLDVMDLVRLANEATPMGSSDEPPDLIAQLKN